MKMKTLPAMINVALVAMAVPAMADQGISSSAAPYLQAVAPDVNFTSVLTAGDAVGTYHMVGLPDGLGAYGNDDGTFTVLMNHELGNALGVARAHGGKGAFVSEWVIDKNTLQVISGGDLIKNVHGIDGALLSNVSFSRFCSADLALRSAFYNKKSKLGSKARIFLNGEEGGSTGYALAHVASGRDKGETYILGKFNLATNGSGITAVGGWENLLANPNSGDKTVVIGTNDGGTGIMTNTVAVYVGNKTDTGSEVDKAGLTNGVVKFIKVEGANDANGATADEFLNTTTRTTRIVSGTSFTLSDAVTDPNVTTFSRPEDGAWADAKTFYFVTTDRLDQTDLAGKTQQGGTRLWKLNFNDDYTGGTIDVVVDTANWDVVTRGPKPNMFDNISVNTDGTLTLQEDVGNAEHNGKVWQYAPINGNLTLLSKFDPLLFGDIDSTTGLFTAGSHTKDEETSGVIDVTRILDREDDKRYSLLVAQDHASASYLQGIGAINAGANPVELVEGGQLLLMSRPEVELKDENEDENENEHNHAHN
ncbi:hypothetical protein [Methylomicrobium sp. Wu6]|uniref:hypothetical protein n=1 Tax=Methylomicrobium sp. Wu6 TaxID=3107928 RepID=UPI002DD66397|nr:hypothetical protein [Methylomicrobium sp. Wu6]MEC4749066.1 hypothetical protein [Methylomicrobium sp. Wu6]